VSKILVIGSANVDLVMATDRLPAPGETIFGNFSRTLGGKGANQAIAAARAGGDVAMVACLGSDEFGAILKRRLVEEGVDTAGVIHVEGPSGVAAIVTAASGTNMIVVASGANSKLEKKLIKPELFTGADYLLLQLEIPLPTVIEAIGRATQTGAKVILDPAPAAQLPHFLLERVDWLTPNETEVRALLRLTGDGFDGVEAAYALRKAGARNVIVKLGERGVVVLEADREPVVLPAVKVDVVDTTAAGDAFNGAFAVALAEGETAVEAARIATVAAAIAVSRPGAQSSMATRQEIDALYDERIGAEVGA
jgi:ribokinase